MMKKLYLALSMGLFVGLYSQTVLPSGLQGLSTENYVFARTYLDYDTITNQATKVVEAVTYYDGLGRPKQSINIKASPTGKDVVTTIPYDGFGRQVDSWLPAPMASLNGAIQAGVETAAVGFYNNDPKPFSRKKLENSPLDRIDSLVQAGSAWSDYPVIFDYGTNKNEVKNYTATFDYTTFTSTLSLNGLRAANTLYKNTVNDEDGNTSIEYKNGEGQTILVLTTRMELHYLGRPSTIAYMQIPIMYIMIIINSPLLFLPLQLLHAIFHKLPKTISVTNIFTMTETG
ncbi:MAG: DUF6443 domain-containing protein [Chitinophagales bacterium]|nr:DUF6443 domain-containing protein [Chitinophagales bacterium]